MILEKKTSHLKSVSLSLKEFEAMKNGEYTKIRVFGPTGKFIKEISVAKSFAFLIAGSKLLPTSHKDGDGETRPADEQAWYWVVNLPRN